MKNFKYLECNQRLQNRDQRRKPNFQRATTPTSQSADTVVDNAIWKRRELARSRQIAIGKARPEYKIYTQRVPRDQRTLSDPDTPRITDHVSKRMFDKKLREWRRQLHCYDDSYSSNEKKDDLSETSSIPWDDVPTTVGSGSDTGRSCMPSDALLHCDTMEFSEDEEISSCSGHSHCLVTPPFRPHSSLLYTPPPVMRSEVMQQVSSNTTQKLQSTMSNPFCGASCFHRYTNSPPKTPSPCPRRFERTPSPQQRMYDSPVYPQHNALPVVVSVVLWAPQHNICPYNQSFYPVP